MLRTSHLRSYRLNMRFKDSEKLRSFIAPKMTDLITFLDKNGKSELNHHAIDNGDITSDVPLDSRYDSVPDQDTTPIKSIDDDGMDHLLELFHIEHDDYLLDFDLHMLQA